MRPPIKESPAPTRSTMWVMSYRLLHRSSLPLYSTPPQVLWLALMLPLRVMATFFAAGKRLNSARQTSIYFCWSTLPEVTSTPLAFMPKTLSASSSLPRIRSQCSTRAGITSDAALPYFHRFLLVAQDKVAVLHKGWHHL